MNIRALIGNLVLSTRIQAIKKIRANITAL